MINHSPLTLAFLKTKPIAAGRVLAAMTADEAAGFLDAVPTRFAATVLAAMGSWSAAVVVNHMATGNAAAALQAVDYPDAAAILRHLSAKQRSAVLSDLPKKLRQDFEASLAFPADTVGAHLTVDFLALGEQHDIGDAIDLIQRSKTVNSDVVFIVDQERKLTGAVPAYKLLQHPRDTLLGEILDRKISSISARSTMQSLNSLSDWSDYSSLPVVSRQNNVIGTLSRKALALANDHQDPVSTSSPAPFAISMLDAFAASAQGLTRALLGFETNTTASNGRKP